MCVCVCVCARMCVCMCVSENINNIFQNAASTCTHLHISTANAPKGLHLIYLFPLKAVWSDSADNHKAKRRNENDATLHKFGHQMQKVKRFCLVCPYLWKWSGLLSQNSEKHINIMLKTQNAKLLFATIVTMWG